MNGFDDAPAEWLSSVRGEADVRWVRYAVLGAVVALAALLIWQVRNVGAVAQVGDEAPLFNLPTLTGGTQSLTSLRGKIVVINFWTTWCDSCKDEMPALQAFAAAHQGDVVVLGVDRREPAAFVRDFVSKYGVRYPILLDVNDSEAKRYGVTGVPETFVVDPQGRIAAHFWQVDRMTLDAVVAQLGGQ